MPKTPMRTEGFKTDTSKAVERGITKVLNSVKQSESLSKSNPKEILKLKSVKTMDEERYEVRNSHVPF